jgi:predicted permease
MTVRRRRTDDDFRAEVEAHLELEKEALRSEGVPEGEAADAARRAFGNVLAARERFHEARRLLWADHFRRDLVHAARGLRRSPGFALAATLSLALGIGANAAIFSVVNALILRPYAFPDLERLVSVAEVHYRPGQAAGLRPSDPGYPLAPADLLDLRRETRSFQGLAAWRSRDFTLVGSGEAERLPGRLVAPELFPLLGASAERGRTLLPEDAEAGRDAVVVVSHGFWRRRMGSTPDVVGRSLVLNGQAHAIVGVMPASFAYPPGGVEVWAPLTFSDADRSDRTRLRLAVVARLAPGASLEGARTELDGAAARLAEAHPASNAGRGFRVVRLREQQAGLTGPFAALFQGASILVLLIACANVGSVLLARGLARRREMALRAALGASRSRIARQVLTEGLLLALLGLVPAWGVAAAAVAAIRVSVPPDITKWLAGWSDIRLDVQALAVGVGLALVTALLVGASPALGAARLALNDVLRDGARGLSAGRRRWRSALVVTQMVLALVLLVGASLLLRGFGRLTAGYEGFDPSRVATFRLRLPDSRYAPGRPAADFFEHLLDDLAALPGVEQAAAVTHLPGDLGPVPGGPVSRLPAPAPRDLDAPMADYQTVSPGYFRALRVRVLSGRAFGTEDGPETRPVAVVSASLARRLWPGEDPLGRQVKGGPADGPSPWREVVGVVGDVAQYWFDREPRSTLYLPQAQAARADAFVVVRLEGEAAPMLPALRARVAALDRELPVDEPRSLRQVVDDGLAIVRLSRDLLFLLGVVAAGLAALGVYGVTAQDVAQRTPELGLRLALGAGTGAVRRLVLGRALALAGVALLGGVPLAFAASRLLAGALFGVVEPDVALLSALALGLVAVAALSVLGPARRAARLDPAEVLRAD